jgi:hypothetical protein
MNSNFQFEFNNYINQKRLLKKIFDETLISFNEIAISQYFTKGMTELFVILIFNHFLIIFFSHIILNQNIIQYVIFFYF